MKWAVGVTTVKERLNDLLPKTLKSLAAGGFDQPRLFVDDPPAYTAAWGNGGLSVTHRSPRIRPYGNWLLALAELVIREPLADRYMIVRLV